MALNNQDQAQIREYLLGKLSEAEEEKIEERLMVEDELFDELEASKDELVEEYCGGELDEPERRWLEDHFLASPEGRQRQAFVLAMDCLHNRQPVPVRDTPDLNIKRLTLSQRIWALFNTQRWATATVAAVLLAVGVVVVVNRMRSHGEVQIFSATITSNGVTRGEETVLPTKINLPPNTTVLNLRLQFTKIAASGTRYQAELDDRFNRKPIEIVQSDPDSVTVSIPATMIPRGQYAVKLLIVAPDGNEQERSYRFTVE